MMNPQEIIEQLAQIEAAANVLDYGKELKSIGNALNKAMENTERNLSKLQIAEELDQEMIDATHAELEVIKELKDRLQMIFNQYKEAKEAVLNEELNNLNAKKKLIQELSAIVESEENIGAAFKRFNDIREEWKQIGNIPRKNQSEIADQYGKLIEAFFYNINIYKELQDHDLKKNLELKKALIERLKGLDQEEGIKMLDEQLKQIQKEWDEIGPTFKEEWEAIKEEFWTILKNQYNRVNEYYKQLKEQAVDNEAKKREIIALVSKVLDRLPDTHKGWDEMTGLLIKVQDQWKLIGPAAKEVNEELWQDFRKIYDQFFDAKKTYYESLRGTHDQNKELKEKLIEKAKGLKESQQWKEASDALIKLQKRWKEIGSAGKRYEQRLWKEFRGHCDAFFERKKSFFGALENAESENLAAKKELIEGIKAIDTGLDKDAVIAALKDFSSKFNGIGNVPRKVKDDIYKAYKDAIDEKYAAIGLDAEKLEQIKFNNLLEDLSKSNKPADRVAHEMSHLLKQEDVLKQEKIQLENNLGFFGSNPNHPLLKEVKQKIAGIEKKIKGIAQKKTLLRKAAQEIENQKDESVSTSEAENKEA